MSAAAAGAGPEVRDRYAEVDWIKAVGIVTVVVIHALRPTWSPHASDFETWLTHQLRFAVPGFLFCTGFLQARASGAGAAPIGPQLRRLLVPYLVASIGAFAYEASQGQSLDVEEVAIDLLTGSAFLHYYYVFVAAMLVIVTPIATRASHRTLVVWTGLLLLAQALWYASTYSEWESLLKPADQFWRLRSPVFWWSYFFVGWMVRLHAAPIRSFATRWRVPVSIGLGVLLVGTVAGRLLPIGMVPFFLLAWLQTFACLAWIASLTVGRARVPAVVVWLSEATYAIYLFHLFFLLPLQAVWPQPSGRLDPLVLAGQLALSLIGVGALVALARRVLGRPRARLLLGA